MASLLQQYHDKEVKRVVAEINRRCAIDVFKCFLPRPDLFFLYNRTDYEYDPQNYKYAWSRLNYDPRTAVSPTAVLPLFNHQFSLLN